MYKLVPLVTLLLLAGCSTTQQDALLKKLTDIGRNQADLSLHSTKALDVEMSYLERQGSGPVVVLVHGFSANKDTWLAFIKHLPKDWHIIVPDLAGHGDSSIPVDANYQLLRQTERLHALLTTINTVPFNMVGNSMGGAISALYAIHYPDQVASLTLIDSAGLDGENPSEFMQALAQGQNPLIATDAESFETRWNMVMSQPPFAPWPIRPALIRQTLARQDINQVIFKDMMVSRDTLPAEHLNTLLQQHVKMPVLIIWGEEDRILDVSAAYAFKKQLPQAELEIYAGVGHLPQVEIPKQSAQRVTNFINAIAR